MQSRLTPPDMPQWLLNHVGFLTRYAVDVGGYRMHVMECGEGTPVLLLHGNPTWGYLYRNVAARLAGERVRLIMPDLVGLGFSDKPRDARVHTIANHARWIAALLDALELSRVIFVGQDWGGPIGLRALADTPERLAGLVVLNTVLGPPKPGFRPTVFHRLARVPVLSDALFRLGGFPQRALGRAQGDPRSIAGEVAMAYRYPLRGLSRNAAPLALARMVPDTMDHPSVADLARCEALVAGFRGPSVIVWGDRDPVLGKLLPRIERALPMAPVVRTRAGHFLQEEVPAPIAAAVRSVARAVAHGRTRVDAVE